ncbi:MAG: inositol monophosphatase [Candidatus Eisenbacteria bacterium]|nr:inositol monophosphatase [Candidatus Eisenbacteria bacterium]
MRRCLDGRDGGAGRRSGVAEDGKQGATKHLLSRLPVEDDIQLALRLALEAGDILMQGLGRRHEVSHKGWRDLVSETDLASEDAIAARLRAERPDDAIHAEEHGSRQGRSGRRWVVDPLDGTTNFVHAHPLFCVSIALEVEGRTELGVIWAPYVGELFWAQRGRRGALVRLPREGLRPAPPAGERVAEPLELPGAERPLEVSGTAGLQNSLLATGFPYRHDERRNTNLGNFNRLTPHARGIRRGGSAALDLAYVAAGRFDGFWELYLNPWDVAAGALLVAEAGGRVSTVGGGEEWRDGREIVASNGLIHNELSGFLEPADPRADRSGA